MSVAYLHHTERPLTRQLQKMQAHENMSEDLKNRASYTHNYSSLRCLAHMIPSTIFYQGFTKRL
jgi:hypothetical protein